MTTLSAYTSHDAAIAFRAPGGEYRVYELERFARQRYFSLDTARRAERDDVIAGVRSIIQSEYPKLSFGRALIGRPAHNASVSAVMSGFNAGESTLVGHHLSHAAGAFRLSGYETAIVLSFDGGGFDEDGVARTFGVFLAIAATNEYTRIYDEALMGPALDFGWPFARLPVAIKEISKGSALSYPGKIMGLSGYGAVRPEWVEFVTRFYREKKLVPASRQLPILGRKLGLDLSENGISGKDAYDLAATSQHAFETLAIEALRDAIGEKFKGLPICVTGGCALNVLFNQRLREEGYEVFVPPNPNDCGLAFGQLMLHEPPDSPPDITYSGFDLIGSMPEGEAATPAVVARLLADGKIVGVARGRSECGPRALGNRSILCDPSIDGMKDTLNKKVKGREWFRPFAPVVKADRADEFFFAIGDSPFMSFAPRVHPDWVDRLKSVTHVDGTSRAQTLTREQNPYVYDILGEFEKIKGFPVLLNTSLNIKGQPIATHVDAVLEILNTTEMDCAVIGDSLVLPGRKMVGI